jgi:3-hydroxyisobutyrate dehydrogenase-like beta-hydroxyacid dehydrogenase
MSEVLACLEALGTELSAVESSLAQTSARVVSLDLQVEDISETLLAHGVTLTQIVRSLGQLHDLVAEALDRTPPAARVGL